MPPGEEKVPEDSSQGPTQEETDEVQLEFEAEQIVEEQNKSGSAQEAAGCKTASLVLAPV